MGNETDRDIKRGDLYWVKIGDGIGFETIGHRPVVVISSNRGNETSPLILGAYTTTKTKWGSINIPIKASGTRSYVMCNQIECIDKTRVLEYMGTLSEEEMSEVDKGLRIAMALNLPDVDTDLQKYEEEIRELTEEIASLKAKKKDADTTVAVERDMYKRMYEKALDMLVAARMGKAEPEQKVEIEVESEVEDEPTIEVEEPEPKVEINTCSREDLQKIGCDPTMIHYIIEKRPYSKIEELKAVPRITRIAYQLLESRVCCVPVKKEKPSVVNKKVNVNTATVEEMVEIAGMSESTAKAIRGYRNTHGRFEKLEDLLNVCRFGTGCMEKYGSVLEV